MLPPVLAAAVALLAAACGNDDDTGPAGSSGDATVHLFDEVQASEMTFEVDPFDPTRGIFRLTTTEPMIYAIVWEPTTATAGSTTALR